MRAMRREAAPADAWAGELPFGDVLRRLRLEAELSQELLAERARISLEAVSALERGTRKRPQRETVLRLAEGLALEGEARAAFERAAARGRTPRRLGGHAVAGSASTARPPANLPLQVTSFVARDAELGAIGLLIERSRLVTLTGSAGVGKTRAALAVAATLEAGLKDGAWFVDLAPLAAPSLVAPQLASALGIATSEEAALDDSVAYLRHRHALLVFDNCEHLVPEAARIAESLVRRCERLTVLATSRERLNVPGELVFRMPSLPVPGADATLEEALEFGSVRLFVERAAVAGGEPTFMLDERNVRPVIEICRRLDGIPLAIELAAARVRTLPPAAIEAKLEERFELLKGGSRTALPKAQTLRAAIEWSYALLSDAEQRLFEWLSVFAGYPMLDVLTAACAAGALESGLPADELEVLELVSALADKSLVEVSRLDDDVRYGLLDSTRRFAREKLHARGRHEAAARAHAVAMLALAEDLDSIQPTTPDRLWYARVSHELDDWRLALAWSLRERNDVRLGQRLAAALQFAWVGATFEGHEWIRMALGTLDASTPDAVRARLELCDGYRLVARSRNEEALEAALRARELYVRLGDRYFTAWCDDIAGLALTFLERTEEGRTYLDRSLRAARELGAEKLESYALQDLAVLQQIGGDLDASRRLHAETLELFERTGDEGARAVALAALSDLERRAGNLEAALSLAQHAFEEDVRLGRFFSAAEMSCVLIARFVALGRFADAARAAQSALRRSADFPEDRVLPTALAAIAVMAVIAHGEADVAGAERAARLFGFGQRTLSERGRRYRVGEAQNDAARSLLQQRLGAERFAALENEGGEWRADRAIAEARRLIDATARAAASGSS